jgi:uncharacterized protein GlcG (DUF336 family)
MLASIQIAEHKARAAATFRRPTKVFEDGINLMHLNYLLAFDGVIASRGGIPLIEKGSIIGAVGVREARIPRTRSSARQARQSSTNCRQIPIDPKIEKALRAINRFLRLRVQRRIR